MDDCSVFVGLDYHQKGVQVCVVRRDGQVLVNRKCRNDVTYTIYGTGDLVVEVSFDPGDAKLPDLPRLSKAHRHQRVLCSRTALPLKTCAHLSSGLLPAR